MGLKINWMPRELVAVVSDGSGVIYYAGPQAVTAEEAGEITREYMDPAGPHYDERGPEVIVLRDRLGDHGQAQCVWLKYTRSN